MTGRGKIAMLMLLVLAGCTENGGGSGTSFQERYFNAREALEAGQYKTASAQYRRLVMEYPDGTVSVRLNLEMAHALLRDGQNDSAAKTARALSQSQIGAVKALALAVLATAQHEMARQSMAAGDYGPQTRQQLVAAAAALDEMLTSHPELDEGNSMARRRDIVKAEIKAIG